MYKYYIGKSKIVTFDDVYCIYRCSNDPENSNGAYLHNISKDQAEYKNHFIESLLLLNTLPDSNYVFKPFNVEKNQKFFEYWDAILIKVEE